jgi:hypothetical protein
MMLFPATKVNNIHFNSRVCFKTFFALILVHAFTLAYITTVVISNVPDGKQIKTLLLTYYEGVIVIRACL